MNNELNSKFLKQICGNAEAEFCLYNPRSKSGIQTWEIKVRNTDNTRKIIVVRDYGYKSTTKKYKSTPLKPVRNAMPKYYDYIRKKEYHKFSSAICSISASLQFHLS